MKAGFENQIAAVKKAGEDEAMRMHQGMEQAQQAAANQQAASQAKIQELEAARDQVK